MVDSEALSPPERPTSRPSIDQPVAGVGRILSNRLTGNSSWYCRSGRSPCHYQYPDGPGADLYAAAGPRLRAAICGVQSCTSWRGRTVEVNGVPVRLVDWCQCYRNESIEKVIDLYWDAWVATGGGTVTIRW